MADVERGQPLDPAESSQNSDRGYTPGDIAEILTNERLTKYFQRVGPGNTEAALGLYCWNHDVGAAFNVSLQQFEVCLRNQIATVLREKFSDTWFGNYKLLGANEDISSRIKKAVEKATENKNGFTPNEHDVIAASSLSLWREFCQPKYAGLIWYKKIEIAFPFKPATNDLRKTLEEIYNPVHRLVKLRNRIAHHEHVMGSYKEKIGDMLVSRHTDMSKILSWMSPSFHAWLKQRDRFHELLNACPLT